MKLWSEITLQSIKGHICFTKPFLIKMGCEISGWRFFEFCFFYAGFYCMRSLFKSISDDYRLKFSKSLLLPPVKSSVANREFTKSQREPQRQLRQAVEVLVGVLY